MKLSVCRNKSVLSKALMNVKNILTVCEGLNIEAPTTWKEAFQRYEKFTHIAENGFSP